MHRALKRSRVQVLSLHHIFEDEESCFRALLSELSREHEFIGFSAAMDMIATGVIDKPYVAISFDDGLKNCIRAMKILEEFDAKACFFVCPPIIGETNYSVVKEFCVKRLHIAPTEFMNWDDINVLIENGHEVGGHTLTHANLSLLSGSEIRDEVAGCFKILRQRVGSPRHFAWPYGRFHHFNPLAAEIVFETGFETCASAERGCHVAATAADKRRLCVRRDHTIAKWPVPHILYFLARNSLRASVHCNEWPEQWGGVTYTEESFT
jgi:peptidoglycan/xylan/chitin deacetylase (PgdA/CDA1 family)